MASQGDLNNDRTESRHPGDRPLEDLLAEYVDRVSSGEEFSPEDVLREHPEFGQELLDHLENFTDIAPRIDEPTPLGTLGDYTLRR